MAISKKGFRKVIVNKRLFYWKFNEKILVTCDEITNSLLIVDFGWYDVWLYVNDEENRPPDFEPRTVTPKFVSESISFALNNGWEEGKVEIEFKSGLYRKIKA